MHTRPDLNHLNCYNSSVKSTAGRGAATMRAAFAGSPEEKGHAGPVWFSVLSFPLVILLDMQNI